MLWIKTDFLWINITPKEKKWLILFCADEVVIPEMPQEVLRRTSQFTSSLIASLLAKKSYILEMNKREGQKTEATYVINRSDGLQYFGFDSLGREK